MRRQDTKQRGFTRDMSVRLVLTVLSSLFLFLNSCGTRDSFYLESETTEKATNTLNLAVDDADDSYFKIMKPSSVELYKANVLFDEWIPFHDETELVELTAARPGTYTIHLQIARLTDLGSGELSLSSNDDILVDEVITWKYQPDPLSNEEEEKKPETIIEESPDGEEIEKEGGRQVEVPAEEEPVPIPVEELEDQNFEDLYWSYTRDLEFVIFEETLDDSKDYEVDIYGGLVDETQREWIPYVPGMEYTGSLLAGEGTKWVWIKYREKESQEIIDDLTKATPILLDPRVSIFFDSINDVLYVKPPSFYEGNVSAVSLFGCEQTYELVNFNSDGYECDLTGESYEDLSFNILFANGNTFNIKYESQDSP